jgi:serine/threonine-protein kinase
VVLGASVSLYKSDIEPAFDEFEFHADVARDGADKLCYRIRRRSDGLELMLKIVKAPAKRDTTASDDDTEPPSYELSERFRREIETMKAVNSSHLASIVDGPSVRRIGSRDYFYYLEPFYGETTLRERLAGDTALSPSEVIQLGIALTSAIEAMADIGIVHRDIKPSNICIQEDGRPVLLDLGIAHSQDDDITGTNEFPMTKRYAAPEQFDPSMKSRVDERTDLFQVGIVLFMCLTGRHPFGPSTDAQAYIRRLNAGALDRVAFDSVDNQERLKEVIVRLLEPEMTKRYRTAARARNALEATT